MVAINFVSHDGVTTTLELPQGGTLMHGAVAAGIAGIDADCGGQLSCATCRVEIGEPWRAKLPSPKPDELAMLEFAAGEGDSSRLSCQIAIGPELDGMVVNVPATQQ